jgi:multimeric flavodoxin WrbA
MRILNIITSPRRERSASIAIAESFLSAYKKRTQGLEVDTLDVWTESLPEFDAEAIGAKYKGVSGEPMTPSERMTWERIKELASRFQKADRIVLGVPMWNFSIPYKAKTTDRSRLSTEYAFHIWRERIWTDVEYRQGIRRICTRAERASKLSDSFSSWLRICNQVHRVLAPLYRRAQYYGNDR